MKPRMKLPESAERDLEGLSDADRFQKVMGRLVQVKPADVKAREAQVNNEFRESAATKKPVPRRGAKPQCRDKLESNG